MIVIPATSYACTAKSCVPQNPFDSEGSLKSFYEVAPNRYCLKHARTHHFPTLIVKKFYALVGEPYYLIWFTLECYHFYEPPDNFVRK